MRKLRVGIAATVLGAGALVTVEPELPEFEVRLPVDTSAMLDVTVTIKTISHVTIDRVGDSVWEAGSGSGFLVSREGCELWTAHHVIEDAAIIEVFPRGWTGTQGIAATPVNSTPRPDVAVLRMEHCDGLAVATLGDSDSVKAGDETYAVGNPLGQNPDSISRGIVSHTQRYLKGSTAYLQTDAAINPGNSGGPLFDRGGKVVGMNTAIASTTGKNIGIGYAVPIDQVKSTVAALHQGPPQWGDAGLEHILGTLTRDEARLFKLPQAQGAAIITGTPGTDGPAAGKLEARDVIYRIGGRPVADSAEALRVIRDHDAGAELRFDFVRGGQHQSTFLTLANGWNEQDRKQPDLYSGVLGMDLEMWPEGSEGMSFESPVITKIHSLGPAHRAQISSSQRNVVLHGRNVIPYQLDVKTVTGLVFEGTYHPITDLDTLQGFAAQADSSASPLLLEIQLWSRKNHTAIHEALEHTMTAFFRVEPRPAESVLSEAQDGRDPVFLDELDQAEAGVTSSTGPQERILAAADTLANR